MAFLIPSKQCCWSESSPPMIGGLEQLIHQFNVDVGTVHIKTLTWNEPENGVLNEGDSELGNEHVQVLYVKFRLSEVLLDTTFYHNTLKSLLAFGAPRENLPIAGSFRSSLRPQDS